MSAAGGVLNVLKRARGELHWTLAATVGAELLEAIATVEAMAGALAVAESFISIAVPLRAADRDEAVGEVLPQLRAALSRYRGSAAPAGDGKWLDIPPFLRRDATPEEVAAYEAKQPAAPAGGGDELPEPFCTEDVTELAGTKIVGTRDLYTAEQMREYGERCRRLASAGSASCAECGAALEEVRPGKHQHPTCSQHPSAGSAPAPSAVRDWKAVAAHVASALEVEGWIKPNVYKPPEAYREDVETAVRNGLKAAAPTPEAQASEGGGAS